MWRSCVFLFIFALNISNILASCTIEIGSSGAFMYSCNGKPAEYIKFDEIKLFYTNSGNVPYDLMNKYKDSKNTVKIKEQDVEISKVFNGHYARNGSGIYGSCNYGWLMKDLFL